MPIVEIRLTGITGLAECLTCTALVSFKCELLGFDDLRAQLENLHCPSCRNAALELLETTLLPLYECR